MEIERLHESHRAERGVVEGKREGMERGIRKAREELEDMKQQRDKVEGEMNEIANGPKDKTKIQGCMEI